jgi:hypothetical protein
MQSLVRFFLPIHSPGHKAWSFFDQDDPTHREVLTELLARDWKAFYNHRRKPNAHLNETLMHVPGRIPAQLLTRLHLVEPLLVHPVTDRVELMTLLAFGELLDQKQEHDMWETSFFVQANGAA